LLDRGWSAADCGKLACGNILRVLRDAADAATATETAEAAETVSPAAT
jgi:hypothetical protein